ncbi:MAG TPA: sigma-70 family RNA polymerase sigma factor [Spirochaetia bacterium]|nr:sigma-70 family RNA polymerase sigma factor [Spirochaetia bacterium]
MDTLTNLTDEKVVELVRKDNKEYYAELMERYQIKLLRYAGNILRDEHNAADVVQNAFIKAYVNLNGFNVNKKFSSWIYRIVHNEAMNEVLKNRKQIPIGEDVEFDSGVDIEEDFIKKEMMENTHSCLNKMPGIYREPLVLYYLEEKNYTEISDILRLPVGTVGTRINRAKILMKSICQKIK